MRLGLGENSQEPRKKKKVQWSAVKRNGLWWTPSGADWKNVAHPVDRTANWCIGGCWFTLAGNTRSGTRWRNAAHPMDRTANWCTGGCWFTLALWQEVYSVRLHPITEEVLPDFYYLPQFPACFVFYCGESFHKTCCSWS